MCSGGRIVNYLKAILGDSRHEVRFTGCQANGTPGAVIQASEGAQERVQVELDGGVYEVCVKVVAAGGYSEHSDQKGLMKFALGGRTAAGRIVIVQGEIGAERALAAALRRACKPGSFALEVTIP